jgi:hypothetical protein
VNTYFTRYLFEELNNEGKKQLSKPTKQDAEDFQPDVTLRIAIPANMSLLTAMNSAGQSTYRIQNAVGISSMPTSMTDRSKSITPEFLRITMIIVVSQELRLTRC